MAKPKIGSKHPTKPGLVYGYNGRYVAKSTFQRQKKNQIRATKSKTKAPGRGGAIVKSPKGAITKAPSGKPASQRVERVKVKVDGQRQLSGSGSKPALKSGQQRALPSGRSGPRGRASAKRAQAAAKAARAAQGSTTPASARIRVGQPKGAANRFAGADRVAKSVNRAVTRTQLAKFSRRGGLAGLGMAAAQMIGENLPGQAGRNVRASFKDQEQRRKDALRLGKGAAQGRGLTKPTKRGMSNLGSGYKADEARLAKAAKTKPKKAEKQATVKPAVKASQPANTTKATKPTKSTKTAKPTKRTDRMSKVVEELKKMQARSKARQKAQKPKLSKRKQMLNRKKKRLEAAASGPGASARDKFFNRKARRYS